MYDAEGAGGGINTRTGTAFGGGVAGCCGWLDCAGTAANAVFHTELKGAATVPGVTWDTFPCTLLDEEKLYGDAK